MSANESHVKLGLGGCRPEADDMSGSVRNRPRVVSAGSTPIWPVSQLSSEVTPISRRVARRASPTHFYHYILSLVLMNVFLLSLALFLAASTSHAIRIPVSRFKLPASSPLEKRAQNHGGTSYNILAASDSSNGLMSVHFLNYSANVLIHV